MNGPDNIVIVNDDPVQLEHMRWALERGGYQVRSYAGGVEMLAELPGSRVDLFVLDLHMPEIDGWKLCSLLRSPELWEFNETPVLVVSATFSGVDAEEITSGLGAVKRREPHIHQVFWIDRWPNAKIHITVDS